MAGGDQMVEATAGRAVSAERAAISIRSWGILAAGVGASLAVWAGELLMGHAAGAAAQLAFADLGEAAVVGWAAIMVFGLAMRLPDTDVLQDQWLMIAASIGAFFIGDLIWTWYEVGLGEQPPFPGWPDLGYAVGYLLFALAVLYAAITYAHGMNLRGPTWLAMGAGLALTLVLIPAAVVPITRSTASTITQGTALVYVFADVWLRIVPALLIVLVLRRAGLLRVSLAWLVVAAAAAVLAVADIAFGVLQVQGAAATSAADLAFMLSYSLLAVAASIALDAHESGDLLERAGSGR